MSKANRLIEMMITINAKRHFTVRELADEFSVSKRTILRDLQALEQAGIPLYSQVGAAGGYHILKERVLPPITFSESEAKAIFFACQSLQFYRNLPFAEETAAALKKFLNCLSPDMQNGIMQIQSKIVFWTPDRHCDSEFLLARGLQIFQAGDGLIELDVLQSTLDWIADYCLPLGRHATVLEPPELVDLMKEKVRELHCHYCAP